MKVSFLEADGAHDVHQQLDLSGEPLIPELRDSFELRPPMGLLEYQDLTLQGLDYERQYSDYWNSTAGLDGMFHCINPNARLGLTCFKAVLSMLSLCPLHRMRP